MAVRRRKPDVNKWELVTCSACQAIVWIGEAVVQETQNSPRMFSICCQQGRVKLPPRRQPPSPLKELFDRPSFMLQIRVANGMLSFTSMGGQIDHTKTMLTAYFAANAKYEEARELTYIQFPSRFVYHSDIKEWTPRKHGLILQEEELKQYTLMEIERLLKENDKSLADFPGMPKPNTSVLQEISNTVLRHELNYDTEKEAAEHDKLFTTMNEDQKSIYSSVIDSVNNKSGQLVDVKRKEFMIPRSDHPHQAISDAAYPDFVKNYLNRTYLTERAILAPTNASANEINSYLLS
ncbi:unnamed protein product, partial [Brassica oleracea var. botrytis]